MVPFVAIAIGRKIFRTRIICYSQSNLGQKPLFHVHENESTFRIQLIVLDWDKHSSSNCVGDASFRVEQLVKMRTRLYADVAGVAGEGV